jgi:23S rRNA (guanosine2251-2'-O)-methyltransferase
MNKNEIIYGIHACLEAIEAGRNVERILIQSDIHREPLHAMLQQARDLKIPVQKVPREKLNRITRKNHQGIIMLLSAIAYASLEHLVANSYETGNTPFFVMLDQITDVRNFGAIGRTAESAGVSGIIVPLKGSATINADAMKTSAGALHHVPVCRVNSMVNTIKFLKDSGLHVVGCTEKTENSFYNLTFDRPLLLILGSEESGISEQVLRHCDALGALPMFGRIESLNVSVAAGIAIYEIVRQRTLSG